MSYTQLGYDIELQTPLGRQTVSFDLDQVGRDIAAVAVREAWPALEQRARQAWPSFVDQAIARGKPALRSERDVAIKELDTRLGQTKLIAALTVIALGTIAFGAAWYAKKR